MFPFLRVQAMHAKKSRCEYQNTSVPMIVSSFRPETKAMHVSWVGVPKWQSVSE